MNQITWAKTMFILEKKIRYQFLQIQDFFGLFDHEFSSKLNFFKSAWDLKHGHHSTQSLFNLFIEKEIERSKQSLTSLTKERDNYLMIIIFSILAILVLLGLHINVAFSIHDIFRGKHYWSILSIGSFLIIACIWLFVFYIRRGKTFDIREITLNRYQSFLKELLKNKQDANKFMQQMQKYEEDSRTIIDLTPVQLVVFLNAMLKNIVISTPYNYKDLTQFFEDSCQQSNGEPYHNLQVLLSQYKNEERDSERTLLEVISKLKK